jgi:KUP system potassium uptake protein
MSDGGATRRRRFNEAAHKVDGESSVETVEDAPRAGRLSQKQSFNMAAHKLGYWAPPTPDSSEEAESEAVRKRFAALEDSQRDVIAHAGLGVLTLGALGVVYGDIGTSPLYTEQAIFSSYKATEHITPAAAYGVASLIFWALMIVVSIKYAGFIMRAHNRGDGGIMALTALLKRSKVAHVGLFVVLGIFGAALFFGDGIITPAISVLGAIQGVKVATPALAHLVVPISVGILIVLFMLQRFGSGTIGWVFGPVLLVWFAVIAALGLSQVVKDPAVFQGLSPTWGVRFIIDHGFTGYLVLGGVVLAVTGAEALYADRGHFGAAPIRLGWFALVLPALMLNYLGQAVFILHHPSLAKDSSTFNPFYQMAPHWALWPLVVLAAVATVIASQAVISGSFSVAKQAVQLGFLPRLRLLRTSKMEGQVYVPIVNWLLCFGVVSLTLIFRSSTALGDIYGVAVTGTFILNTVLFLAVARYLWGTPKRRLIPVAVLFLTMEIAFFSSNIAKVEHGAWLPLVIGLLISLVMINWRRGQDVVTRNRVEQEGPLNEFLDGLSARQPPLIRVPGVAVFMCRDKNTTPLSLRAAVNHTHTLHQKVVIVSVDTVSIPHVETSEKYAIEILGHGLFKIFHVTIRNGYHDKINVPLALQLCRKKGLLERNLDLEHASYFATRITIAPTDAPMIETWRKKLFIAMARNASSPIEHFGLPGDRTVVLGSQVTL